MIDDLIQRCEATQKRIAVIGCSMRDAWIHGDLMPSQDGVQKFVERRRLETPGGAAGAARQLCRWSCEPILLTLIGQDIEWSADHWNQLELEHCLTCRRMPEKHRFLDAQNRIVWRHDKDHGYGADPALMAAWRKAIMDRLYALAPDAVLIADYEKGFLTEDMIGKIIDWCNGQAIPVVADAKRPPDRYEGALIKCNRAYAENFQIDGWRSVVTNGAEAPLLGDSKGFWSSKKFSVKGVPLVNHVGAGDAFAAHLTLGLAQGLNLEAAAAIAHSAGRVYVQHLHGCPPWPHEVKRDIDPSGGKVVSCATLPALRKSIPGRVVFTNGCFRAFHAGHASLLRWAKSQGDVLVAAMNSDASLERIKPGRAIMPEGERAAVLASQEAVDWVVVFDEDEPVEAIKALKPDILVKGAEYQGTDVPGSAIVHDVRFAPMVVALKPADMIPA